MSGLATVSQGGRGAISGGALLSFKLFLFGLPGRRCVPPPACFLRPTRQLTKTLLLEALTDVTASAVDLKDAPLTPNALVAYMKVLGVKNHWTHCLKPSG